MRVALRIVLTDKERAELTQPKRVRSQFTGYVPELINVLGIGISNAIFHDS